MLSPGHEVDRVPGAAPPALDDAASLPAGVDVARDRVAGLGGRAEEFAARVGAAVALAPALGGQALAATTAVAAWRSGVLAVRDDALARCGDLLRLGGTAPVGVLLGLRPDDVADFVAAQRHDRFAWPGWRDADRDYVLARVGGFAGLGGPWTLPPVDVVAVEAGAWLVRSGPSWWRVDVDIFGHVVAPAEAPEVSGAHSAGPERGAVEMLTTRSSYLAHVVRRT